jgi:UTP--glucose-1-phosphate uridylyltransferase
MKKVKPIRKAVFPVAGLGTRFLPATKAIPKEMLTIVDRPLIQVVVDEAREAGIEHLIFVTGRNKGAIEDHFDQQFELETTLSQRGKSIQLQLLKNDLPAAGQTSFTRQQAPLGLGHAIWCARHLVGNEPFAVLLPDMIMKAKVGCLSQMVQTYHDHGGGNVLAVEETAWEMVHRYGIVAPRDWKGNSFSIEGMVEKPDRNDAPSNLIISGRYILQPEIFLEIEKQPPGAGGEIQLTDAMIRLMKTQAFNGVKFVGKTFDCGDKLGFLAANIAFALDDKELALPFKAALKQLLADHNALIERDSDSDLRAILDNLNTTLKPEKELNNYKIAS